MLGLVAFNNFPLASSVGQALSFFEKFAGSSSGGRSGQFMNAEFLRGLADVATMVVQNSGLEFEPSPPAVVQGLTETAAAAAAAAKTSPAVKPEKASISEATKAPPAITAVRFSGDSLDSTTDLEAFPFVEVVELSGEHLSPVFVEVSAADIAASATESGLPPLDAFLDERGAFAFGDEEALENLVSALSAWLIPSQIPWLLPSTK
jgi:hypothetical protein